jgi:hypothetical protein
MPAATTDRSSSASISADGRLVVFTAAADNLAPATATSIPTALSMTARPSAPCGQACAPMGPRPALSWAAGTPPSAPTARWWPLGRRGRWWLRTAAFPWTSSWTASSPSRPL